MRMIIQTAIAVSLGMAAESQGQEVRWTRGTSVFAVVRPNTHTGALSEWLPPGDLGVVQQLVVSNGQAVARLADGSLRAWGPLGSGVPSDIGAISSLHATFAAGEGPSPKPMFAVLPSGEVRTWIAGGTVSRRFDPPGLGQVKKVTISLGGPRIALRTDGTVWSDAGVPMPDGLIGCIDVAASRNFSCDAALKADGTAIMWGSYGDCDWVPSPVHQGCSGFPVVELSGSAPIRQLAGGEYGIATIDADGHVVLYGWRWGGCNCPTQRYNGGQLTCDSEPPYMMVSGRAAQPFYGDFRGVLGDGRIRTGSFGTCSSTDGQELFMDLELGSARTLELATYGIELGTYVPVHDLDGDGLADHVDNCPGTANPEQANVDGDRYGDVCDQAVIDCDQDNVEDALAISQGLVTDVNGNSVPDLCDCLGDVDGDALVNGADIGAVLAAWGLASRNASTDTNRDGAVDGADLGVVLSQWGPCPN